MPVETALDRAGMLGDWDTATYTPPQYPHPSGETITISGIFDTEYVEINQMESLVPTFTCRTADVSAARTGARMTVDSVEYSVRIPQSDGTGMTTLILEKYV